MPATHSGRPVRKPAAATVSRLLADNADFGLHRAERPGATGFTVKDVRKEQERYGGPVIVWWTQGNIRPEDKRTVELGRNALIRRILEECDFAVAAHPGDFLVLLDPEDVHAHDEAVRAAAALLGEGRSFDREESGPLIGDQDRRRVSRVSAVAEIALALRNATSPYGDGRSVVIKGDTTVTLTPMGDQKQKGRRSEPPAVEARRILGSAGENILDTREAATGTGVWVRPSGVSGEVLILRKDEGRRASGFGAAARRWTTWMEFYRRLLEDAGWTMTGRGEMGWSLRQPTTDDALTRAEKALGALWPRSASAEVTGWFLSRHEGHAWNVQWRSALPDEERRAVAAVAMLPYLADVLRRVGLSTTVPDELPHPDDCPPYAPAVYFAEPPAERTTPRYRAWEHLGRWWVDDTDTGYLALKAANEDHAIRRARHRNWDEETSRQLGRTSSDDLPGSTSDVGEVPEFRALAAELAAAGYMPADHSGDTDRPADGFLLCSVDSGLQINHLTTQPDGMNRITPPVDPDEAAAHQERLRDYWMVLDAPGRIVEFRDDHLMVYGIDEAEEPPVQAVPAETGLFDAAVTFRVDHGVPRTAVFRLSAPMVDPYGHGAVLRHKVAEAVAVGGAVDRYVIDGVHAFEPIGTRRHRAQVVAARMLSAVLGDAAVWSVAVDPLWRAQLSAVEQDGEFDGVLLLSVPDDAPADAAERIRVAAQERGWSPARLSESAVWVNVRMEEGPLGE
ncbi:hypothetical protein [Streptomyces sp. MBT27]|uniref:hypothetical protein n=1 Tax=Streptomyces sp. MBT27 TaxID=1488356 RepID=UPI001420594E|nr:hypothetical protein [Streptomyces sp. MBT27]